MGTWWKNFLKNILKFTDFNYFFTIFLYDETLVQQSRIGSLGPSPVESPVVSIDDIEIIENLSHKFENENRPKIPNFQVQNLYFFVRAEVPSFKTHLTI